MKSISTKWKASAGAALVMAAATVSAFAVPVGAVSVTNSEVSVGSPHNIAPRSHQNAPAGAMDARDPSVLVAGSNDYIDQQPSPEDISRSIAQCDDFTA